MCTLCSSSSFRPNKLRHILKFTSWYTMKHIFVPACLVGRKTWFSRKTWFLNVKVVIKKYQSLLSAKKILVKGWVWHFLDKVRKVVFSLIFFLTFSPQTYRIDFVLVLHRIISSSPHPSKTDHPVQALPRIAVRGWINNIDITNRIQIW